MNLFLREMQAYRKSLFIWAASLSGIVVIFMAMYPAFSHDIEALNKVLEQFPPAFRAAFNLTAETFFSASGFFGYLLGFAVLAAAIQAMNLGVGVISKEVAGKTADFLLTKPITRTRAISAKLAAVLLVVLLTNLVFLAVSFAAIGAWAPGEFEAGTIALMSLTMLLVQLMFLALGALFAVTIPKIKSVVSVSLPTVFALYIAGALGDVLGRGEVRYLSPFKYFDPIYIIQKQSIETKFLLIDVAFVVLATAASYVIFVKKDIRAAI